MNRGRPPHHNSPLTRFEASRRAFLRKGAGAGAVLFVPAVLAACGNSDEAVFGASQSPGSTAEAPSAADTTTAAPTTDTATPDAETSPDTAAAGDPLAIAFTYTMAAGGKQLNPYVAAWVEDTDGVLLRTLGLFHEQSPKGSRWLDDLRAWWRVDQDRIADGGDDIAQVISSATRSPGEYSLRWDGLDDNGEPVTDDDVVFCIESARERGPYSLICEPITRSAVSSAVALPDNEELSGAIVTPA